MSIARTRTWSSTSRRCATSGIASARSRSGPDYIRTRGTKRSRLSSACFDGGAGAPPSGLPSPASAPAPTGTRTAIARAATAPARTALRLRPRLVDDEVAIAEQPAVQHLDGLGRFFLGRHLDEAEAARTP